MCLATLFYKLAKRSCDSQLYFQQTLVLDRLIYHRFPKISNLTPFYRCLVYLIIKSPYHTAFVKLSHKTQKHNVH